MKTVKCLPRGQYETLADAPMSAGHCPERRTDGRTRTIRRLVRVSLEDDHGLAWCRNISDGGMKLDLGVPVELNDRIEVSFSPSVHLHGTVIWTNGHECGVKFEQEIDSSELLVCTAAETRATHARAPRLQAEVPARVNFDGKTKPAVIRDISQRGMKLSGDEKFWPGLKVTVLLGHGKEVGAVVRWSKENIAGLFLDDPLSVGDLGSVRTLAGGAALRN